MPSLGLRKELYLVSRSTRLHPSFFSAFFVMMMKKNRRRSPNGCIQKERMFEWLKNSQVRHYYFVWKYWEGFLQIILLWHLGGLIFSSFSNQYFWWKKASCNEVIRRPLLDLNKIDDERHSEGIISEHVFFLKRRCAFFLQKITEKNQKTMIKRCR